jgi:hypothetical protein
MFASEHLADLGAGGHELTGVGQEFVGGGGEFVQPGGDVLQQFPVTQGFQVITLGFNVGHVDIVAGYAA